MARARDTNRAIAKMFGVPEKTNGSWKSKDNWNEKLNGVLQSDERSTPNKAGAPKGNVWGWMTKMRRKLLKLASLN